jgi:16S rRNA (uracil1498-N3)-methyltransferase
MHVFYQPQLDVEQPLLNEEESRHAVRVLRLYEGDELFVTNGLGQFFRAQIALADPKRCVLTQLEACLITPEPKVKVHLAIGATKNMDRMEWLIEKATEIGLDTFIPLECEHGERTVVKKERLEKVAIAAMKQSQRAVLPQIMPMTSFQQCIKAYSSFSGTKLLAHCASGEKKSLKDFTGAHEVLILIGPEGDFSAAEIANAQNAGCEMITLGTSRLRTETAALFALTGLHIIAD